MRRLLILAIVVTSLALPACSPRPPTRGVSGSPSARQGSPRGARLLDPEGNFTLFVSNQSFDLPTVDIAIEVDGQRVAAEDFAVETQHNHKRFVLRLADGPHTLAVRSVRGAAGLERSFTVTGKQWASLDYWYYSKRQNSPVPRSFAFIVSDKPLGFD